MTVANAIGSGQTLGTGSSPTFVGLTLSGTVTNSGQPMFSARYTSNVTNVTGNAVVYTPIFDTADINVGTCYNTSTGVFTAPNTANYLFSGCIYLNSLGAANTVFTIKFITTPRNFIVFSCNAANTRDANNNIAIPYISPIIPLSSTNTVSLNIEVDGGTQIVGIKGTAPQISYFSGILLG